MISSNTIGLLYLFMSILLFFYGIKSYKRSLNSYLYAIALNVFPLIFLGYLGNERMRLGRIPIAYFPLTASFFSSMIISKAKILKKDIWLFFLYLILISYLFIQSFIIVKIKYLLSFVEYYFMWVLNILLIFYVSYIVSQVPYGFLLKFFKRLIHLITICSVIGILKYFVGLQSDANFMPMMNRNGTAYLIVMVLPFLFYLKDVRYIKFNIFILSFLLNLFCILLIKSRMGIFGFASAISVYYIYRSKAKVYKFIPYLISFSILLFFLLQLPIFQGISLRLQRTLVSLQFILSGEEITPRMSDYARFKLIIYAIEIIKSYFWFGTGVGLENYRAVLRNLDPIRESKPHNFYLSYLAEFGMIGFSLLMIILIVIWMKFKSISFDYRLSHTFKIIFITVMLMLFMNEYITFPFTWFIFGIGIGVSNIKVCE